MPRPVYLMLCHDTLTEAVTNMFSAFRIIERVTIDDPALETKIAEAELPEDGVAIIQHEMSCAAWFVRSDYDRPEVLQARFGFRTPDGRFQRAGNAALDFSSHTGVRIATRLPGFPWGGFGLYWFVAQVRATDEEEWVEITSFPLEVVDGSKRETAEEERVE